MARIDKLGEQLRKPRPLKQKEADQAELSLLKRIADLLEQGQEASQAGLKDDEEKLIRSFQLLTLKKQQVFVNLGEALIGTPLPTDLVKLVPRALSAPAKLELELEELAAEDRIAFMRDLGLSGFARGDVLRQIFTGMGYRVFFTVGEDECRAWPIPEGTTAVDGAGEIHSDLARGFVRAEVVSFDDFKICGSMKEAKNNGVYRLEGKNYIVNDGDIMHILHS
ncbi:MAG: DUF933 domain-containing protein [Gemmataceae bacterium]|nr:DUF933 domain-containing protein [Gemmataceae bacterium]